MHDLCQTIFFLPNYFVCDFHCDGMRSEGILGENTRELDDSTFMKIQQEYTWRIWRGGKAAWDEVTTKKIVTKTKQKCILYVAYVG